MKCFGCKSELQYTSLKKTRIPAEINHRYTEVNQIYKSFTRMEY